MKKNPDFEEERSEGSGTKNIEENDQKEKKSNYDSESYCKRKLGK